MQAVAGCLHVMQALQAGTSMVAGAVHLHVSIPQRAHSVLQLHVEVQRWGSSFKEGCINEPCLWEPGCFRPQHICS